MRVSIVSMVSHNSLMGHLPCPINTLLDIYETSCLCSSNTVYYRSMNIPAISFQSLTKVYGNVTALKNLCLDIQEGEFFGLLGPNGAGKTTSLNTIAGLVQPTKGTVVIKGLDAIRQYRQVHSLVGITFQDIVLDSRFLNVREILVYHAGYFGIPIRHAREQADKLLQRFDLWEKRSARAQELSGGMKRRLMIAKALIHDPDIIILDEPTAGADVELRLLIWEMMEDFHMQGKTIVLTTHYLEEAERLCDRVAIIHQGRLLAVGSPKALMKQRNQQHLEDVFLQVVRDETV